MKATKRTLIIATAIIAVIALTMGIAYAAWDNSKAKGDYVVVTGTNADMKATFSPNNDGQVLVPKGQIGLGITGTKKTAQKALGTINISLNNDAETADLVVVYDITKIYSVPKDNTSTFAQIAAMNANALSSAGIIDLNVEKDSSKRYITGATALSSTPAPKSLDLRINFVKDTKNYSAGEEIPFDVAADGAATINGIAVSMEFTRNATEEFTTMDEFKDRKIMFEITLTLKVKTPPQPQA